MDPLDYDIIIAGAGPSGLAASITLNAYGINHCIINANDNAVYKPGDALPPNSKPLFRQLGIAHLLESDKHIPYYGNKSIWGTDGIHQEEFIESKHGHGYLIDRLHFENQLRQVIINNGTSLLSGYKIIQVNKHQQSVEVNVSNGLKKNILKSRFIIDATGKKASVCRHLGVYKQELDAQMTCSFWYTSKVKIERQIWIEATKNGWWYLSPSANNKINVMFFTVKELLPKKNEITRFLKKKISNTQHIQNIIQPDDQELSKCKIMPSGTSRLKQPYGDNWLAVGDAAFSYDPISSYGITSALASGYYGAHALASYLNKEHDAFLSYQYIIENGARSYLQKLSHQYTMETRWRDSYFWKNRLRNTNPVVLH